jgi:hypothetical protein
MNLGSDIEVYCNESGYNLAPDFGGSGGTVQWQATMTNRAMARLLACGLAKLTVFNAGGDGDTYGLLDKEAKPRPAYAAFMDYLELARKGGRRLDTTLLSLDGKPIEGVYVAAATHDDGSITLVVNPADVDAMTPADDPSYDFTGKSAPGWVCFTGKVQYANGRANLTPGDKGYNGFFNRIELDPQAFPKIAVNVPECTGRWTLTLKFGDGETVQLYDGKQTGEMTFDYLGKLKNRQKRECEVSFRFFDGAGSLAYVHFPAAPASSGAQESIPVRLLIPVGADGYAAKATVGGASVPAAVKVLSAQGQRWAEVDLALTGRAVVTLAPATQAR